MPKVLLHKGFLVSACFFCLTAPCVGYSGVQLQSLFQKYGQPTIVNHLPNGNTVYIFSVQTTIKPPVTSNSTVIVAPGGRALAASVPAYDQQKYIITLCTYVFETDRNGAIIRQERQGPGC